MITLGTVIFTELQKPGLRPLQSRPVQACEPGVDPGLKGRSRAAGEKMLPSRISGIPFSDVTIMT